MLNSDYKKIFTITNTQFMYKRTGKLNELKITSSSQPIPTSGIDISSYIDAFPENGYTYPINAISSNALCRLVFYQNGTIYLENNAGTAHISERINCMIHWIA